MMRLMMALQLAGGGNIPADFDLRKVRASDSAGTIVVTARRQSQRIERLPEDQGPPLGRAEVPLFGKVKGNVHVESADMGAGAVSKRVMVGIKLPF